MKLWDHESGEYIRTLKGHTNTIHSLAFTPTGSHLVSTSSDLSIKLWDFTTYACVRTLRGHDHTISSAKFLPSPALLYNTNQGPNAGGDNLNGLSGLGGTSGSGGGLNNTNTSGIDTTLTGSNILVSASRDKSVKFWDLETGYCQYTLNDHNDWVRCIAVRDYDGNVMATAGNDLSIFVYNVIQDGGKEFDSQKCMKIATLTGHDHVIESIAFVTSPTASATSSSPSSSSNGMTSPTSTSASLSSPISMNGRKASFSSSTESSKTSKQKHTEKINNYLASGSRDRTVKLWNIQTQSCIATFASHENWVRSVVLHPSGKYIISAGDDRTIRIMDIQSNRCLRKIANAHPHFVTCLAIHYSLPIMVSGGVDQMVRCWQLE
jgi:platelet-activating factor acetylhydrolase IB subunit alpha